MKKNYHFSVSDIKMQLLVAAYKASKNKKEANKINAIILLIKEYTFEEIENILLLDERHIRRLRDIYLAEGINGLLLNRYKGGKTKLTDNEIGKLKEHLQKHLCHSAAEICAYVLQEYGKDYTAESMVQFLKRLGFAYKKTKIIPGKADIEKQKQFLEDYQKTRKNLKKDEKIYFLDAVHPTHNVMPAYAWIEKGKERGVKSNSGRQRININGVYSPIDYEIIVRDDETINAQSTIKLMKMIEKKHPELTRIIIYSDRARYYTAKILKEYLGGTKIDFIPLPTYSPNLNLIERLWKYMKKNVVYNKYYEQYEEFKSAVLTFLKKDIKNKTDELASLMTENFHLFAAC